MDTSYSTVEIDRTYFSLSGLYFMYMPVRVPYAKLAAAASEAGYELVDTENTPIIESASKYGRGWVGVEVVDEVGTAGDDEVVRGDAQNKDRIRRLKGEFNLYKYLGAYKHMKDAYQMIMADHPEASEFYNLYLNSPKEVSADELLTEIYFR